MEVLTAPNHKENILKALSQVPMATTKQLSMLNDSLNPRMRAAQVLKDLREEKLIQGRYHRQQKVWYLSRRGKQLTNTQMRLPTKEDHALAVINLYFTLSPSRWQYEPVERFTQLGRELVWNPDCIFAFQRKVYVCEVQLTPLTPKKWTDKWKYFNAYFNNGNFHNAAFQAWSSKTILPQFLCITSQQPETVKVGFEVKDRELIVCRRFG